jgi:hypothetical protein
MDANSSNDDKFSIVYERLEKFVYLLAWENEGKDVLMEFEEIVGELQFEMVKGFQHYEHLPVDELVAVIKTMLRNRVSELIYRFYLTHRQAAANSVQLGVLDEVVAHNTISPERSVEFYEALSKLRSMLSDEALRVLDVVIGTMDGVDSQRMELAIKLSSIRSRDNNACVVMRPSHIAQALLIPEKTVKVHLRNIMEAYYECRAG